MNGVQINCKMPRLHCKKQPLLTNTQFFANTFQSHPASQGESAYFFSVFNIMQYGFKTHGFMKFTHKGRKENKKSYSHCVFFFLYSLRSLRLNPIFMCEKSKRFRPALHPTEFNFQFKFHFPIQRGGSLQLPQ
jgi:hypothetical protein